MESILDTLNDESNPNKQIAEEENTSQKEEPIIPTLEEATARVAALELTSATETSQSPAAQCAGSNGSEQVVTAAT